MLIILGKANKRTLCRNLWPQSNDLRHSRRNHRASLKHNIYAGMYVTSSTIVISSFEYITVEHWPFQISTNDKLKNIPKFVYGQQN